AAAVAEGNNILVKCSTAMAQNVAQVERIGLDGRATSGIPAGGAEVMQPLEVAALTLPVPDGVVDKLKLAQAAEIRNRKYALEHTLEAGVVALTGQQIHLQKALIRLLLNLNQ